MSSNIGDFNKIEGKELVEYTIVPYRGKLDNWLPEEEETVDAELVLVHMISENRIQLSVDADLVNKRVYIEERKFNKHWKRMKDVIFQVREARAFKERIDVPVYSDMEKQVDLSLYENENRRAVIKNDQIKIIGKPLSEEARCLQSKRASAMDNKKIRYVFSAEGPVVHDKACPLVKHISDKDFRASEELPEDKIFCQLCGSMIYIRKGCGDDFKNYGLYQQFFKRGHVGMKEIERLVDEYHAVIHMEHQDMMRIKCGEDWWKLVLEPDGKVTLLHNNYIMISETERYISSGFHNQNLQAGSTVTGALRCIENYTWEGHLAAAAVRQEEEMSVETAEVQQELFTEDIGKQTVWTRLLHYIRNIFYWTNRVCI